LEWVRWMWRQAYHDADGIQTLRLSLLY